MPSIDLDSKLTGRRRRTQRILEYACRSAVVITAMLMLVFFTTLGYRGIGAFTQTKIDVDVATIESTTKKTINQAMYQLALDPDRKTKKGLRQLVTPNAYSKIDITEPGTYTLVAHTNVDMYVKGVYDKLTDSQRPIVDKLIADDKIYRTWNWDFWRNSDSRSPEIAGIWGALIGTVYTIGLAVAFAFPIGVGCATYMEEFPKRKGNGWSRYRDFMEININNLAAVPSIVYGLLGLSLLINFFGMPRSASLVGGITLFWVIEGLVPTRSLSYKKWRHALPNFFFTTTSVLVNFFLAFLLLNTADWTQANGFGLLHIVALPLWLYVVLGVLLLDFIGAYLAHLVEHKVKPLWMVHLVHHSDHHVDTTTANRHHPFESLVRFSFTLLAVFILGAPIGVVMLYQSLSVVLSQFNHANINLPLKLDQWLSYVLVTPHMHKVHHHYVLPYTDSNYGNIFAIWDRLFGTYSHLDAERIVYGVDVFPNEAENSRVGSLLKQPFQPYQKPTTKPQ